MSLSITEFNIVGLHRRQSISIPIKDNRIVLVGINGLGKTTVVNVLYYFLTRQWHRLSNFHFDKITLKVSKSKSLELKHSELLPSELPSTLKSLLRHYLPISVFNRIIKRTDIVAALLDGRKSPDQIRNLSRSLGIPSSILVRVQEQIYKQYSLPLSDFSNTDMWAENIRNISDYLEKEIEAQILYLPTYRRIEQDLKALFPNVDEDNLFPEENINDLKSHEHGYIELIQFGMEDVQKKLNLVSEVLKERARTELNSLAGSYLRDVIRGEATVYDKKVLSNLNNEDVNKMFARVEENTLNEVDKQKLRNVIEKLKSKQIKLSEQESYLAHFFSKLVDIHHAQQKKEEPIRQFIEICNKYLEGKRFIYDEVNYAIIMKMKDDKNIELRNLSSGEKQIVSLFSQIYLGEPKSYYVIIDEPELSLSVEWQKTLLPDIINSGRCKFLAAVTHSPFIFANQLDSVTRDMSECISTYHGSR